MTEEWLVDGCNLLYADRSARSPKRQTDRARLLSELAGFSASKGQRMLVVLDGKGRSPELEVHRTKLFDVIYSQNSSADACIERLLFERKTQVQFRVVTDDRAIANMARGAGALVIGTKPFMEMMQESRKESSEALQKGRVRSHGFHRPFDDKLKDK